MATQLERAKGKLTRLNNELETTTQELFAHMKTGNGQPMNDKGRAGIRFMKRHEQIMKKGCRIYRETQKQTDRVEMLEVVESFKKEHELLKDVHVVGKTSYANIGAKTSVNNLDYFRDKLENLIIENEQIKATNKKYKRTDQYGDKYQRPKGTEIRKLKNKISYLESIEQKTKTDTNIMTNKTKKLIESGKVRQWKKKPVYYFVQGLHKVALIINDIGEFETTWKYAPTTEVEKQIIAELLK